MTFRTLKGHLLSSAAVLPLTRLRIRPWFMAGALQRTEKVWRVDREGVIYTDPRPVVLRARA